MNVTRILQRKRLSLPLVNEARQVVFIAKRDSGISIFAKIFWTNPNLVNGRVESFIWSGAYEELHSQVLKRVCTLREAAR